MLTPQKHIHSVVNPDGAVLLDEQTGIVVNLNGTGGYVWQKIIDGLSEASIVRSLVEDTGVDPLVAKTDLGHLLAELQELNLVIFRSEEL